MSDGCVLKGDGMFDSFKEKAEAVSSEVYRFSTVPDASDFIVRFLKSEGVEDASGHYAVWADDPFLAGVDKKRLAEQVPGLHFTVTRDMAAGARVGISQACWGLANTGTLVLDSTAIEQRLVSTLPEIHIALLAEGSLLPDLPSLFSRIDPVKSAYIAFISGPSRTADIERVLTIGVHGPKRLVVLCVDKELSNDEAIQTKR